MVGFGGTALATDGNSLGLHGVSIASGDIGVAVETGHSRTAAGGYWHWLLGSLSAGS
jgi:hypothetical protein